MDPNATLDEIMAIVGRALDTGTIDDEDAIDLVALVEALDHWLAKGGVLPLRWRPEAKGDEASMRQWLDAMLATQRKAKTPCPD